MTTVTLDKGWYYIIGSDGSSYEALVVYTQGVVVSYEDDIYVQVGFSIEDGFALFIKKIDGDFGNVGDNAKKIVVDDFKVVDLFTITYKNEVVLKITDQEEIAIITAAMLQS